MNGYNFTERVRRVLTGAREQAFALRHEYVGTEHILLALLDGGGVASAALEGLGVKRGDVRQKVLDAIQPGRGDAPRGPDLPYTSRAKKSLEFAMSEARSLHHGYVGTEHLLLGLMREERNIAAQSLAAMGLTVQGVRDEVLRLLGTEMPEQRAAIEPRVHDDRDQEAAITLVIEHPDGRIEARKFRRSGEAVSFLNGLEL
jgi:ATP-dependent Clp protease ATP-binding subunit ClpC